MLECLVDLLLGNDHTGWMKLVSETPPTVGVPRPPSGATEVVDPRVEHPVDAWARVTGGSLVGGSILAAGKARW